MKRWRTSGILVVATVLLVVGHMLSVPSSISASTRSVSPSVPNDIAAPPGSVLLLSKQATGVQTYECKDGQWAFRAPKAVLFDPHHPLPPFAVHYGGIDHNLTPGPWWESLRDGSRIRAGNPISAPSPNPNSIPQLRLDVLERHGTGVLRPVTYIQRLNTVGGVGPTGACSPGAQRWVPYTADYAFYTTP